jgi:hypothetical protein
MTDDQMLEELKNTYGTEFTAADVRGFCAAKNLSYPTVTRRLEQFKTSRGRWNLEVTRRDIEMLENSYTSPTVRDVEITNSIQQNLIPEIDDNYVKFGNFTDIKKIIQSGIFYPTFITGLSGNGKTLSIEQACAVTKREFIRVNITVETDADDLIGHYSIKDGNMVWNNGPVVEALERGAILLLDECLDENEEVLVGTVDNYTPMKLADMEFNKEYPVVSFNMETGELENDIGSIISDKDDEIYEVELEDGRVIRLNSKHPFIVQMEDGTFAEKTLSDGLSVGDEVVSYI